MHVGLPLRAAARAEEGDLGAVRGPDWIRIGYGPGQLLRVGAVQATDDEPAAVRDRDHALRVRGNTIPSLGAICFRLGEKPRLAAVERIAIDPGVVEGLADQGLAVGRPGEDVDVPSDESEVGTIRSARPRLVRAVGHSAGKGDAFALGRPGRVYLRSEEHTS